MSQMHDTPQACPECGTPTTQPYCGTCGAQQPEPPALTETEEARPVADLPAVPPGTPRSPKRRRIIAAVGLGLVLILVGIAAFLFGANREVPDAVEPGTSPPEGVSVWSTTDVVTGIFRNGGQVTEINRMSSGGELMLVSCNTGTLEGTLFTYEQALFGPTGDSLTLLEGNKIVTVEQKDYRIVGDTLTMEQGGVTYTRYAPDTQVSQALTADLAHCQKFLSELTTAGQTAATPTPTPPATSPPPTPQADEPTAQAAEESPLDLPDGRSFWSGYDDRGASTILGMDKAGSSIVTARLGDGGSGLRTGCFEGTMTPLAQYWVRLEGDYDIITAAEPSKQPSPPRDMSLFQDQLKILDTQTRDLVATYTATSNTNEIDEADSALNQCARVGFVIR